MAVALDACEKLTIMLKQAALLRRTVAATTLLALSSSPCLSAAQQAQHVNDPANLTGERVFPRSPADTLPVNHGVAALQQLLLKLRTRASMMLIIAHPDDEDGGLLTYESRGQGVRTAMLTLTRGEGGQNLMSADFNDALGLIRTQELLSADRYFGTDQFFGTEVDFGFSKTREEALSQWTHDRVLYDAVRAVRLYRPLVLASVFVGGATDGHGQHQVSGQICQEVFKAAADPKVFPEMIQQGLLPWAPLKVYARVPFSRVTDEGMFDYATGKIVPTRFHNYVTGEDVTHEPAPTVLIHEGEPAAVLGKPALGMEGDSYLQFARKGLALQKSQIGAGVRLAPAGAFDVGYTLMASRGGGPAPAAALAPRPVPRPNTQATGEISPAPVSRSNSGPVSAPAGTVAPEKSLFDGIDVSLPGIAGLLSNGPASIRMTLTQMDATLAKAQQQFDPAQPARIAPQLQDALSTLDALLLQVEAFSLGREGKANLLHELRIKRAQLNEAVVLALGIRATAAMADSTPLTPGAPYQVRYSATDPGPAKFTGARLTLVDGRRGSTQAVAGSALSGTIAGTVPSDALPTEPPFHQEDPTKPYYTVDDPALRNAPQTPAPMVMTFNFNYQGTQLEVPVPVTAAAGSTEDAASGSDPLQPAVILPAYSAAIIPAVAMVSTDPGQRRPIPFTVEIRTNISGRTPRTSIQGPTGWEISGPEKDFTLEHAGDRVVQAFRADPGPLAGVTSRTNLTVKVFTIDPRGSDNTASDLGYRPVGYAGITRTNLYKHAQLRVAPVDVVAAPNLRVAYLPGTGDSVPDFLPLLGITPALITPADLTADKLKQFDAVLVGVRAYAAQSALAGKGSQPLIEYAKNGGVVILEYMTARFGDPEAPFPISVPGDSAHNVVVEADPVTILAPRSPVLNWPNKISSADFQGWTEEWGHGFAAGFSSQYQPLLEIHDPEQDPQKGGLLLAPVGKGAYIYCALALYRQLPEGVPGAYRLLANLLSYRRNPQR